MSELGKCKNCGGLFTPCKTEGYRKYYCSAECFQNFMYNYDTPKEIVVKSEKKKKK